MQQEITVCLKGMKEWQGVCDQSAEAIYTLILRGMLLHGTFHPQNLKEQKITQRVNNEDASWIFKPCGNTELLIQARFS